MSLAFKPQVLHCVLQLVSVTVILLHRDMDRSHIQDREKWKRETLSKIKETKIQMMKLTGVRWPQLQQRRNGGGRPYA
jgi:hypothetical protein